MSAFDEEYPLVRAYPLPPIMYITLPAHANSHLHHSIGREICWLRAFKVLRVQCPSLDHDCDLSSFFHLSFLLDSHLIPFSACITNNTETLQKGGQSREPRVSRTRTFPGLFWVIYPNVIYLKIQL